MAFVGPSAYRDPRSRGARADGWGSPRARGAVLAVSPALLLAYDAYVLARYVIPFRGL